MDELERLITEQAADDTTFQRPESQNVSLDVIGDYIGGNDTYFSGTEDEHYSFGSEANGIYSFMSPQKGDVLVGDATWHGTLYGSRNKKCKCGKCTEAGRLYQRGKQREWRDRQRARTNSA